MFAWFTQLPIIGQVTTVVTAVIVVALLAMVVFLKVEVSLLRSDVENKAKEIGTLTTQKAVLESSINTQNVAIDDLKKHGDALQGLLNSAINSNVQIAAVSQARVTSLSNAPVPKDCPGAVTWLAGQYNVSATTWNNRARKIK